MGPVVEKTITAKAPLGLEPFDPETCRRAQVEPLTAEGLGAERQRAQRLVFLIFSAETPENIKKLLAMANKKGSRGYMLLVVPND